MERETPAGHHFLVIVQRSPGDNRNEASARSWTCRSDTFAADEDVSAESKPLAFNVCVVLHGVATVSRCPRRVHSSAERNAHQVICRDMSRVVHHPAGSGEPSR